MVRNQRFGRSFGLQTGLLAILLFMACSTLSRHTEDLQRYEFSEPQMDLPFRIVVYAGDKPTAEAAARAAFDRLKQLNDIFSDYEDDSELSRLSQTAGSGQAVKVSDEL